MNRQPNPGSDKNTWGTVLNSYLSQLSPSDKGGINYWTNSTKPTGLTPDDEGRTGVNTETQSIERWDGTGWVVLLNAQTSLNSLLPNQAGNTGKALVTDGTNSSWQPLPTGGSSSTNPSIQNYVISGLTSTVGSGLTTILLAGLALIQGTQVSKSSATISYPANKVTRDYLLLNGTIQQDSFVAGAEIPVAPANSVLLQAVSTNASTVTSIVDFRPLEPLLDNLSEYSFDYNKLLVDLEVTTGTYAGAYRSSLGGKIIWYFSNLALLHFVDIYPNKIKNYLNLYISKLESNKTVKDIASDLVTKVDPDSHDSYASTFLMLACKYVRATQDLTWWNANLINLKDIAYNNLAIQVKSSPVPGLISVFQAGSTIGGSPASQVGYLMDNCENYGGLKVFADLLTETGNAADGTYYGNVATSVMNGIGGLWDNANSVWLWVDVITSGNTGKLFYPALTAQIFPELYQVPVYAAPDKYAFGYKYLNDNDKSWWEKKSDSFPWLILGYFAALRRKDVIKASKMLSFSAKYFLPSDGRYTIENIGWAQGIQNILTNKNEADGIVPLNGIKTVYVAATSGGAATTKLTFKNGILVATLN